MRAKKWKNDTDTPTYNSWRSMRNRILFNSSENHKCYKDKGISICSRWIDSYDNFFMDMGERPSGTTLDRIDSNGDYEPSNCRWATMVVQQNNKYDLTKIEHNGEIKTIGEWASCLGLDDKQKNTVYRRHTKYGAKTYEELFCGNLYSHRKSLESHKCIICNTIESKKWRKDTCNNCYARALRYYKKSGSPIDLLDYAKLFSKNVDDKTVDWVEEIESNP